MQGFHLKLQEPNLTLFALSFKGLESFFIEILANLTFQLNVQKLVKYFQISEVKNALSQVM